MNARSPFPAAISAYLGVTGQRVRYQPGNYIDFPMLCAMIGSGLAGLLCGLNGVIANGIGVGGLPEHPNHTAALLAGVRHGDGYAIVIPVILTAFVYQRNSIVRAHYKLSNTSSGRSCVPTHLRETAMTGIPSGGAETALSIRSARKFQGHDRQRQAFTRRRGALTIYSDSA